MIGELCGIYAIWNKHCNAKNTNIMFLSNFLSTHIDDVKMATDLAKSLSVKWNAEVGWSITAKRKEQKDGTKTDLLDSFFLKWFPSISTRQKNKMINGLFEKINGFYDSIYLGDMKKARACLGSNSISDKIR